MRSTSPKSFVPMKLTCSQPAKTFRGGVVPDLTAAGCVLTRKGRVAGGRKPEPYLGLTAAAFAICRQRS
jgi:hypothetical protein